MPKRLTKQSGQAQSALKACRLHQGDRQAYQTAWATARNATPLSPLRSPRPEPKLGQGLEEKLGPIGHKGLGFELERAVVHDFRYASTSPLTIIHNATRSNGKPVQEAHPPPSQCRRLITQSPSFFQLHCQGPWYYY